MTRNELTDIMGRYITEKSAQTRYLKELENTMATLLKRIDTTQKSI